MPDSQIRTRLEQERLLFLTQDTEFLELPAGGRGLVLVSRLRQSRPIAERVSVCLRAVEELLSRDRLPGTFELTDEGELHQAN
jgi:hypothetical protein